MKYFNITVFLLLQFFCVQTMAEEKPKEQNKKPTATIKETENKNVFKGILYQIWNKVRTLSPKTNANASSRNRVVATAGVRGTETTGTLLQPYWKGDRTNDEQFMKELKALGEAQALIDKGQLEQSKAALDAFLSAHTSSVLKSNALFTKAMVLGGLGETQASISEFKSFVKENPSHPLAADANTVIAELSKP